MGLCASPRSSGVAGRGHATPSLDQPAVVVDIISSESNIHQMQLPPTEIATAVQKGKTPEEERIEREKIAIARQRQDRLDRERLEKNIKFGLGIAGSLGLATLGIKKHLDKMNLEERKLAREQMQNIATEARASERASLERQRMQADLASRAAANDIRFRALDIQGRELAATEAATLQRNAAANTRAATDQYSANLRAGTDILRAGADLATAGVGLASTAIRAGAGLASTTVTAGAGLASTTVRAGTGLATAGMREYANMYKYDPENADAALAAVRTAGESTVSAIKKAGAVGAVAGLVATGIVGGQALGEFAGKTATERAILAAYGLIKGGVYGVASGVYGAGSDLANIGYEWVVSPTGEYILKPITGKTGDVYRAIYDRIKANSTEPVPSYREWRRQFPSLRGQDPIYANTTGLQVPPQFIPDLSKAEFSDPKDLYKNIKDFVVSRTQVFDLVDLSGKNPRKWPQEVFDNIRSLPRDFIRNAFDEARLKRRPRDVWVPREEDRRRNDNLRLLWDLYQEYYGPQ